MQGLGDLERVDVAGGRVGVAVAHEHSAVEQHAHGLDCVERDALGAVEDAPPQLVRETGDETGQQLLHGLVGQRLEVERREAPLARTPGGALVGELGPRQRQHEERVAPRPLEQVLEEVEQAGVGPLHVLEDEHGRRALGEALEQDPPGREEVLVVARRAFLEAEQVSEPRRHPSALLGVVDVLLDRRMQLRQGGGRLLVLDDLATHPDHLRQRPVGDALPVGKAASAMPERVVREAVDVLLELPGEARLPDAGDPRDGDELSLALVG